jgi:RimJ/RimL family protein N-acetyltransferase
MTVAQATRLVEQRMRAAETETGAAFAVVDDHDSLLGSASLLSIDWERSVGLVAYWLAPASRGKGIATRAVTMLCEWAFDGLRLARLELRVDVRNQASQRLAERVGFEREGLIRSSQEIHGERIDEYLYSLLPGDAPFADRLARHS